MRVRVARITAEPHIRALILRGQTEASRTVELKAETPGQVVTIAAEEGSVVKEGATIVELSRNARDARLAEARALVRQRQTEYDAAAKLSEKGFRAETKLAESRALLDAARANLKAIETDIEDTILTAPFDGILDRRYVEIGDFLEIGNKVARVVDLDPIYLVAQVSEQKIAGITAGSRARARLISGQEIEGIVRYVGSTADEATRTFRVEVEVPNPARQVVGGMTAEIRIALESVPAHRVSSAALTLDEAGRIGIKSVDGDGTVRFQAVDIIADETDGLWLGGLPETVDIVIVGQEFVKDGQRVEPVYGDGKSEAE